MSDPDAKTPADPSDPPISIQAADMSKIYAALALIFACVLAYWPGLSGPFVFDDFVSLSALGQNGGVVDWQTFKAYVFGGNAGPTGRPISLFSFLFDATNWPADPASFKRTNLIIHLVNAALLGLLTLQILRILCFSRERAAWLAIALTAVWLLHPFLVSTTLYVVQRMAQLSTLFMLCGLSAYLYYRSKLGRNDFAAYVGMSSAIVFFTLLATFSKENGVLLPLLVGVVELTIIASQQDRMRALNRYWSALFILAPSVVVFVYLGGKVLQPDFFQTVAPRDFSVYERLLTQPRVLFDYLENWFVPSLYTTGVFQDHFLKSTGLLAPATTLLSIVFHLAVLTVAIVKRRKWPVFAFAVLFFYANHLLESTVVSLELYFEHRNYLAAAFLFLPILVVASRRLAKPVAVAVFLIAAVLLAGFTRYSATIWQSYAAMVAASAELAPTSARAQALYATQLFNDRKYEEAVAVLDAAITAIPGDKPLLHVNRLIMLCNLDRLEVDDYLETAGKLSPQRFDVRYIGAYSAFASAVAAGRCPALDVTTIRPLFTDMLLLPENSRAKTRELAHIQYLVGYTHLQEHSDRAALTAFERSLDADPDPAAAMTMARLLATNNHFAAALELSERALAALEANEISRGGAVSRHDIESFQQVVRDDIEAASTSNESD